MKAVSNRRAREKLATLWDRAEDSRNEIGLLLAGLPVVLPASLLLAALLTMASPISLGACSKGTFVPAQPEFYFIFTALPDTVEAGWSGAVGSGGQPLSGMDHPATDGPRWAQMVRLEQVGGEMAKRLPGEAEHLIVVPWDYAGDCSTLPWQRSARFLEPGERGLMYAALRNPEHWVDGMPTADFHLPYSQPFPRHAHVVVRPLMSIEDAFRFHHVLPRQDDVRDDAATALAPLLEWARQNPELASQGPARDMIHRNLDRLTYEEVRGLEVPVAGTYRFVLDLGDGAPRTFYARTRSAPTGPARATLEQGDDYFHELRPPSYAGYTLWAESASGPELLGPARTGQPGGYLYVFLGGDPGEGPARRIPGAADLRGLARALPDDSDVQALRDFIWERPVFREYLERNLEPGADAFFLLHPDGTVTFEQTYHLPGGRVVTLQGVRIQADHGSAGSGA